MSCSEKGSGADGNTALHEVQNLIQIMRADVEEVIQPVGTATACLEQGSYTCCRQAYCYIDIQSRCHPLELRVMHM
jgi:hypothetical protein